MQRLLLAVVGLLVSLQNASAKTWECSYTPALYCRSSSSIYCKVARERQKSRYTYDAEDSASVSIQSSYGSNWIKVGKSRIHASRGINAHVFAIFDLVGGGRLVTIFNDNTAIYHSTEGSKDFYALKGTCKVLD